MAPSMVLMPPVGSASDGFGGFLDRAAAFDDDLALGGIDQQHGAALAFVVAGDDFDLVAFFDVGLDAAHGDENGWRLGTGGSEHLGGEGDDFHERLFAEFAGDGAEDPGAARVVVLVDEHDRV